VWSLTGVVDCQESFQAPPPATQVPAVPDPVTLPATGSEFERLLQLGAIVFAAGVAMLLITRKRRST
jgi:LPXTG-motif cell wall-anchored protein